MHLTDEDRSKLEKLARKMGGANAKTLLSVLGRDKAFVDAISTPLGEEILKDAVQCVEAKIYLVLSEKDTREDRAEIRAYMDIIKKWEKRINQYNQNREKLNQALQ